MLRTSVKRADVRAKDGLNSVMGDVFIVFSIEVLRLEKLCVLLSDAIICWVDLIVTSFISSPLRERVIRANQSALVAIPFTNPFVENELVWDH